MTYSAIAAEGYYQILGMDSSETGQFCRSHGITLEELKEFSAWINANDDIMPASQFRSREKELRKLFKNPISERWGKQICLNERLLAGGGKLLKAPRDESRSIFLNNINVTRHLPIN